MPGAGVAQEAVQYLQGLLRIDTTNPPGNETAAAEYLAGILRSEGFEPIVLESSPGRGNVIARLTGSGEGEPLLLYGHTDVVMAERERWSRAPFAGEVADGCVWGRGALDMKGLVVQELMVMLLLRRSGIRLRRDVIFAATADEEAGGEAGMGYIVDHCPDLVRAEFALSEGGGTTMYVAGREYYDIRTAEKGTCRFTLRATGRPGHGSIPRPNTAVETLARAVQMLATTPLALRPTATAAAFFGVVAASLGVPPSGRVLSEDNLRRVGDRLPVDLRYFLNAISRNTAVPTGLHAGKKINVIPAEAEAWVDGRYLPGQTAEGFLDEVRRAIGPELQIEPISITLPLEDPPGGPLYDTIVSVMGRHAPKSGVMPTMLSGATDAKHVSRLGTKCLGFGPLRVPLGFPSDSLVHGDDERIPIDGFAWGITVLHDLVRTFCS